MVIPDLVEHAGGILCCLLVACSCTQLCSVQKHNLCMLLFWLGVPSDPALHSPREFKFLLFRPGSFLLPCLLQDVILPYMSDKRHIPDTCFIVMEEDWRLFEADARVDTAEVGQRTFSAIFGQQTQGLRTHLSESEGVSLDELYNKRLDEASAADVPSASASSSTAFSRVPSAGVTGNMSEARLYLGRPAKPKGAVEISPHLRDIARMLTFAHRRALGGLVWLSWEGAQQSGNRIKPRHALTCIAMTHIASEALLMNFDENFPDGHFDVKLINALNANDDLRDRVKPSYIYPAIGNYQAHQSGCEKNLFRQSAWKNSWVKEGTDFQNRYLCVFGEKGNACFHCELPKNSPDLCWKTCRPPATDQDPDERHPDHEQDANYQFFGGAGDKPRELVTTEDDLSRDHVTKRRRSEWRHNMNLYKWRNFTDDPEEVGHTRKLFVVASFVRYSCVPFAQLTIAMPFATSIVAVCLSPCSGLPSHHLGCLCVLVCWCCVSSRCVCFWCSCIML